MNKNSKIPTEFEMLQWIQQGRLCLPPLCIKLATDNWQSLRRNVDAIIDVSWGRVSAAFAVEMSNRSTPMTLLQGKAIIQRIVRDTSLLPMLLVPYLAPDKIEEFAEEQFSAMDLCGNGVIIIPEKMLIVKSGVPNRFYQPEPLKNPYRGSASLVSREMLLALNVRSLDELVSRIRKHGADVAVSTASKTLAVLAEELIMARDRGDIRLLQADLLLDKLSANYQSPQIRRRMLAKAPFKGAELRKVLAEHASNAGLCIAASGISSTSNYAVWADSSIFSVYCEDIDAITSMVELEETQFFPDIELIETADRSVYFDTRIDNDGFPWASPIQCYLELSRQDARARSIADNIRRMLIKENVQ